MFAEVLCLTLAFVAAPRSHADTSPPRVLHTLVQKTALGQNVELRVQFQDQSEIYEPKLYFRKIGEMEYAAIDLSPSGKGEWTGSIPATFVTRDLEYFLEAFDIMGNGPGRNGSPEKPHLIKVVSRMDRVEPRQVQTPPQQVQPPKRDLVTHEAPAAEATPVYKKWWFWTIIGVGVSAAVAIPLGLSLANQGPQTHVTLDVSATDPRFGL